jgi:hypothetical protein
MRECISIHIGQVSLQPITDSQSSMFVLISIAPFKEKAALFRWSENGVAMAKL